MAWNIRNDFATRVASVIRKAGQKIKQQFTIRHSVQPIMDYHKVMIKPDIVSIQNVAGNVDTDLTGDYNELIELIFGQLTLDTDATAANRYIRLYWFPVDTTNFYTQIGSSVITANQVGSLTIGQNLGCDGSGADYGDGSDVKDWAICPPHIPEQWTMRITTANGVAGDSLDIDIHTERHRVPREV